jgi:exodeoxyribonuclease-5
LVEYASFTGKAASVMRAKGCEGASTIDSLIYKPLIKYSCAACPPCAVVSFMPLLCGKPRCPHRREEFIGRTLNEASRIVGTNLVVIDEISMVGEEMGDDLLSFGRKVLALGDKAQLSPPDDAEFDAGYFTNQTPDFELTEIHRQARNSPVIQIATTVRNHELLEPGVYGDSLVIGGPGDPGLRRMVVDDMLAHDQVIVGAHAKRAWANKRMREKRGFGGDIPQPGEKVLCEKNDHGRDLQNGTFWTVIEAVSDGNGFLDMTIENDDGRIIKVVAPIQAFRDTKNASNYSGNPFTFGYAITCHKAQGSQWDSVFVIDESGLWGEERDNWLYTAVTRAAKRVTVIR